MMTELPKYYTTLVNAVEDALEAMEAASYGLAGTGSSPGCRRRRRPIWSWGKTSEQQMALSL